MTTEYKCPVCGGRLVEVNHEDYGRIRQCVVCKMNIHLEDGLHLVGNPISKEQTVGDKELREQIRVGVVGGGDTNMGIEEAVDYIIEQIEALGYRLAKESDGR